MFSILGNKLPIPPALAAQRKQTVIEALASLYQARAEFSAAHRDVVENTEARAAVEREIAEMEHPGVDDAAIDAHDARERKLDYKRTGYRKCIADAEIRLAACEARVREALDAVLKAIADRAAPPVDTAADLPKLKAEAARARQEADKSAAQLQQLEAKAAPALTAFAELKEAGAPKDRALQLLEESDAWGDKIEAARGENNERAEAARHAEGRLRQLQERLQAEADMQAFRRALVMLDARRPSLDDAASKYAAAGENMGALFHTWLVWSKALDAQDAYGNPGSPGRYSAMFMSAPTFVDEARVPRLGEDGLFVTSNWRHRYEDFPLRQDILAPLKKEIVRGADLNALFQSGAKVFAAEYEKFCHQLLTQVAMFFAWAADRDAIFKAVGELGRDVRQPELPIKWNGAEDRPWRRLRLPALRANADPIWTWDYSPQVLLNFLKRAEAA